VLPTAIYLEMSVGRLEAAMAISLGMVAVAVAVLLTLRRLAPETPA
jgi:ABC-type sulfate transport system permease component